jgi:hypothetical protein
MEKSPDNLGKVTHRRLSSLKVLSKLMEHELDLGKSDKEVTLNRHLAESMLDTLELFIEDFEEVYGVKGGAGADRKVVETKPQVTRLN